MSKGCAGLVFPNSGRARNHGNIVKRILCPMLTRPVLSMRQSRAKYPGTHAFRHFFATWCINRKKQAGWSFP